MPEPFSGPGSQPLSEPVTEPGLESEALDLDRVVHEPARLAILTLLSSVQDADFVFLQRATGLTKGNLSSHLGKLEEAGLVDIVKRFVLRKPQTQVALTQEGRMRVERHWQRLDRLRELSHRRPGE